MATKSTEHYIAGFGGPTGWTGKPFKDAGSIFLGTGFLTFLLCLVLMIFIAPLRNIGVLVLVCTLAATAMTWNTVSLNMRTDKRCLQSMAEKVNAFILETTGDPTSRIDLGRMQALIEDKQRRIDLKINGVPGVQIKVVAKPEAATRIVAVLTPPDYGLESFDVLLAAECKTKS
jgi:hypothetical protein